MSDGSAPPDLRRQLATLWRAARTGLDSMREVVVRSSQFGKLRLDIALLLREREQLLVALGELVCAHLDEGAGDELPAELHRLRDRVRDIESQIRSDSVRAHDNAFGAPRGYEPEAAADYGDSEDGEDAEAQEPVRKPASPRATKRKKTPSRRKRNGVKNL